MLLTRIGNGDARPVIDRRGALADLVGRRLWLGEGQGLVKVVAVGPEPIQVDGRPSHTYREPGDTMVAYLCVASTTAKPSPSYRCGRRMGRGSQRPRRGSCWGRPRPCQRRR